MTQICEGEGFGASLSAPSNSPLRPFLQNPTSCGSGQEASLDVLAYDGETTHGNTAFALTTGCDQLTFNPSISAKPTTTEADSASGVDIELTVPQLQSPSTPSPSSIRGTTVLMPRGFSINPTQPTARWLASTAKRGSAPWRKTQCPEYAKIGTLTIDTPVLPGPLPGFMYLGKPLPGNRYRIFLTADGFNVHVKLAGVIKPDPVTGQLVVSFDDLPQVPFETVLFHVFGSERGSLATPTKCDTYEVRSTFTPWDEALPAQNAVQFFTIDSGPGGGPGAETRPAHSIPSFDAASVGNTAGAHSPFGLDIVRNDGDQNLVGVTVVAPPGFTGTLKGIPYCPRRYPGPAQ